MKKILITITAMLAGALVLGFTLPIAAQEINAGSTIQVLFDNGVTPNMEPRQAKSQAQLAEWMKNDLVRVFGRYAKSGFQAKSIEKRNDFKPQSNNYLLAVRIDEYKAGSKAARMIVGYGAGGVTLKIHYELYSGNQKKLLSDDDSIFSGREWINAARKLNENTAKAVTAKLSNK